MWQTAVWARKRSQELVAALVTFQLPPSSPGIGSPERPQARATIGLGRIGIWPFHHGGSTGESAQGATRVVGAEQQEIMADWPSRVRALNEAWGRG